MLFRTTILSIVTILAANEVIGAAVEVQRDVEAIQIATSPCWHSLILYR